MNSKELLSSEEIITKSDNDTVVLTNKRIRYNGNESGKSHLVSILLQNISSIEVLYVSSPLYLVFSIIAFVAGAFLFMTGGRNQELNSLLLIVGVVLFIIYLSTRKHVLKISSKGGTPVIFHTKGISNDFVMDFVNKVERQILSL